MKRVKGKLSPTAKRWGAGIGGALLLLTLLLVGRALSFRPAPSIKSTEAPAPIDDVRVAERLAGALRFATISFPDKSQRDWKQWLAFHRYLQASFPKLHKTLTREVVADYSLLYTWPGTHPDLPSVVFLAHQDVVPIAPGTEGQWKQDPFAGKISGGFIWGRGALDDKASLLGLLEAAEMLIKSGYQPKRTIRFSFGHDEEVGGVDGAAAVAELLKSRGEKVEVLLDEGGFISRGSIPGVERPVALVGVAEKGYVSVELVAQATGGHSSMPPKETAIGMLAAAVSKLEEHQLPLRLGSPTREMLLTLAPEMAFSRRVALANLWLFEPLLLRQMAGSPPTNASVRTTTAPTIFQAGIKDNVLPASARAVVNYRLLPGDTDQSLVEHVKRTIDNPKILVGTRMNGLPSPISDMSTAAFGRLKTLIQRHYEDAVVSPFLCLGGTDTKHFQSLTKNVYRFLPVPLGMADTPRIHGVDERIAAADYANAIRFYADAVRTFSAE